MLRKRIAIWMSVAMIFGLIGGGSAHAADTVIATATPEVSATVLSAGGFRVLQAVASPVLQPATGLYKGDLIVGVQEFAVGGASWKVTAQLAGPLTSGGNTIPADKLSMGASTVASLPPDNVGTIGGQESGSLNDVRKIYQNVQSTSLAYTAIHTSTSPLTLTVPNGTPLGLYKATVTITLSTF